MLDHAIEFVGEENVVQVVTNNATNFKAVGELLTQKKGAFILDFICCPLY